MSAFSFYHIAYKERLDTVEKTLHVVEKLRNYRPKHATHKSARTPIFSGIGFPALSQKQHFKRNSAHQPSASQENSESEADHNIKEINRSNQQTDTKYSKSRFPWFRGLPVSPSRQGSDSSTETQEKMKMLDQDIELGPISSVAGNIPSSQVHLNPQEHSTATNLINSPKPSHHPDTILKQFTRVVKNTMLHDARNLRGQTERLAGWNVNSAHEAKVLYSTLLS